MKIERSERLARRLLFRVPGLVAICLLSLPAHAVDLSKIMDSVSRNAGQLWEQRDALLGKIDEDQERELGRAAVAVLLGAAPLLDDQVVQNYVGRVGLWIAQQSERPDLDWRFAVLDEDTINAFAAPGGFVMISRGLLAALRNEAELAGVLAHEIAHVLARHHVHAIASKARANALLQIAKESSGQSGALPEALLSASKNLYASGLDRGDELDADRAGVVLAARAGYDPSALFHVLKTLEGAAKDTELMGLFTSTHPPFDERLEKLSTAFQGPLGRMPGKSPTTRLRTIQKRLR